jgi:hypothetical protein
VSMRVHESGEDNLSGAIDLDNFLAISLYPGVAHRVFGFAGRNNLPAGTQYSAILNDAEILEIGTATRARVPGPEPQGQQLADVHQQ